MAETTVTFDGKEGRWRTRGQAGTPPSGVIRGGVSFTRGEAREAGGGCPASVYTGSATGSLQATFAGWGTRTLLLARATPPVYRTAG